MGRRLFVGRLPLDTTESELDELFSDAGEVARIAIKFDHKTGEQRGFAFVTMADKESADAATEALNGKEWSGRALTVNEARPREDRPRFGGGGDGGGGGGGGGGGRGGGRGGDRGKRY